MTEVQKAFAEELEDIAVEVLRKERHGLVKAEREWIIEELKKRATANANKGMRSARITTAEIMEREDNKALDASTEDNRLMRELAALKFRVKFLSTYEQWGNNSLKCEKCEKWLWFPYTFFCGAKPDCYETHNVYEVSF